MWRHLLSAKRKTGRMTRCKWTVDCRSLSLSLRSLLSRRSCKEAYAESAADMLVGTASYAAYTAAVLGAIDLELVALIRFQGRFDSSKADFPTGYNPGMITCFGHWPHRQDTAQPDRRQSNHQHDSIHCAMVSVHGRECIGEKGGGGGGG